MSSPTLIQSEHDEHRNPMSGPAEAVALYDRAIDRMLRYHPEVVDLATTLAEQHADVPMTGALLAYLHLTSTDEPDVAVAAGALEGMAAIPMNEREQAHHDAIAAWVGGDWIGASRSAGPAARALAHGSARPAGRPPARLLPRRRRQPARPSGPLPARPGPRAPAHRRGAWHAGVRARGVGQLQRGRGGGAGGAGRQPRRRVGDPRGRPRPRDARSGGRRHPVPPRAAKPTGVPATSSRSTTGGTSRCSTSKAATSTTCSASTTPRSTTPRPRACPSRCSTPARCSGACASTACPTAAGSRRSPTRGRPAPTAAPWYVFNDLHAVMALVGAGRIADAEGVVERLAGYVHCGGSGTNVAMTAEIGLPASRAIIRFAQERYADVIDELLPIRRVLQRFGGSHAQRDVLQRTLLEAALQSGQPRPRPFAALGAARGAGDERVRLDPPGAPARGTRAPGRRGRGRRGRRGLPGARPGRPEARPPSWVAMDRAGDEGLLIRIGPRRPTRSRP